jgi:hypothetical protein
MPILTKSTVSKGSPSSFALDKSLLASLASDAYFQDPSNWSRVVLAYRSSVGGQKEKVIFDATEAAPSSSFLVSDKARDSFEIVSIIIYDFDKGYHEIPRSSLTPAEFDVALGGGGGAGSIYLENISPLNAPSAIGPTLTLGITQTFPTPNESAGISGVSLYLMRQSSSDAVLGVRVRNTSNDIMAYSLNTIAHDSIFENQNGDSGEWHKWDFDPQALALNANTTYKFELYCVSGTVEPSALYLGQNDTISGHGYTNANGSTYLDLNFKIHKS